MNETGLFHGIAKVTNGFLESLLIERLFGKDNRAAAVPVGFHTFNAEIPSNGVVDVRFAFSALHAVDMEHVRMDVIARRTA